MTGLHGLRRWAMCGIAAGALMGCGARADDRELIAANNRGVGLMGSFDYAGAHAVFSELVDNRPYDPELLSNLATATLNRQQEGDEMRALELFERAIAADPEHLRARYGRGLVLLYLGRAEEAIEDFGVVVDADPEDADACYFLGQSLMQLERTEEAADRYRRAVELDPYLRSAYYRGFQAAQRLGRAVEAGELLEQFKQLADNPRARLVEFKYSKMGRRGMAATFGEPLPDSSPPTEGPLFELPPESFGDGSSWRVETGRASLTVADIDGDGAVDLYLAGAVESAAAPTNAVLRATAPGGGFELEPQHPLALVTDVNAALWGDVDNDGLTDVYLCRKGKNQLWRRETGGWRDVTEASGTDGGDLDTVDGAMVDADHDGDLDLFLVNADGANELLNNDRDGGFRPLAAERGLAGAAGDSRSVVFADLDGDRDADIVVLNGRPPHEVLRNDLLWQYRPFEGFDDFVAADVAAAVAGDVDADGRVELYSAAADGSVHRWDRSVEGNWQASEWNVRAGGGGSPRIALADVDGDGSLELLSSSGDGVRLLRPDSGELIDVIGGVGPVWALAALDPGRGPAMASWSPGEPPAVYRPGSGRAPFVALNLSGREDSADALRSNASGIGARVAVRAGARWTVTGTWRSESGPGQSLQPIEIGVGSNPKVDFVAVDWSDGVYQTELELDAGRLHRITETQRQLSSCPVLFAWDGDGFAFVSDLLGVGGIGYAVGPGEYSEPRPWENFMLPAGLPAAREGRLMLKVAEPMEEALYLDAARLVAYDLPPGWSMTLDERMGIAGPAPTGRPVFYRRELQPVSATNERGESVIEAIRDADLRAAPVGELDHRFIGMLAGEHVLTMRYEEPIDRFGDDLWLVADGWVEYPYSQTNFAAWQAGEAYHAPSLEARGADSRWRIVLQEFGYPAGMPRRMALPLPQLPEDTIELRLRSNQEIYWDRLAVVAEEPCLEVERRRLVLDTARVERTGFALRTTAAQRLPSYDYARRLPVWDTRTQAGFYTRLGPVDELVATADDALAIIGPGEEVHLEFFAPPAPQPGWRRVVVLESEGWCKDMDLYTRDGDTLEPLPAADRGDGLSRRLHAAYNTRYLSGRQ